MLKVAQFTAVISTEYVRLKVGRRRFTENVMFTADPAVKVSGIIRITNKLVMLR